jgi:ABC-type glycerol-3-phosphate transport system substrate-binding protein
MLYFAASLPFLRSRATRWAVAVLLSLAWLCGLGTARAESASPAARVHVIYWEKWTGFEREAMRVLVDDFNRSQQRIFVDYMAVSAVNKKTLVATAGGNPPDLAGVVAQEVFNFADKFCSASTPCSFA